MLCLTPAQLEAATVYVTYTGTVSAGSDPNGIFGSTQNLHGMTYEVLYVFDTGNYPDSHTTHNFIFGGTAFNSPSPVVPATLTIGGTGISISGDKVGEIVGTNNGPGAFSQQLHMAYDLNGSMVENTIFNYSGGLPATITTPFVYHKTAADGGGSDFVAFGASGNLDVDTLTVSLTAPTLAVPAPNLSGWPMMILGFAGVGFMAYRRRSKPAPSAH
jgi:hypothetical protein